MFAARLLAFSTLLAVSAFVGACSGAEGPRIGGSEDPSTPLSEPAPGDETQERSARALVSAEGKQFQTVIAPQPTCDDCRTSKCKTELDACTADATCPFLRTCLDDCADSACRSKCFVSWPDPVAKAKNGALYKCQCVSTCTTECSSECR